jgi:hypothetical protein
MKINKSVSYKSAGSYKVLVLLNRLKRRVLKVILHAIVLFFFLIPTACEFFGGFNLDGNYDLSGGQYYDGLLYDLDTFEGTLSLKKSDYTVSYQLSFTKKNGQTITEIKDETGTFSNTAEYQKSTYGPTGKYWTGIIFFQPDSVSQSDSDSSWQLNYEYYPSDKSLILEDSREFSRKGYYTVLDWTK